MKLPMSGWTTCSLARPVMGRESFQLSSRAYKQLRVDQLFDQRHVHDIELNTWNNSTCFYFVRAISVGHFRTHARLLTNVREERKRRRREEKKVAEWSERLTSRWAGWLSAAAVGSVPALAIFFSFSLLFFSFSPLFQNQCFSFLHKCTSVVCFGCERPIYSC